MNDDPAESYGLQQTAQHNGKLLGLVVALVVLFHRSSQLDGALEWLGLVKNDPKDFGTRLIERLSVEGKSIQEVTGIIVATAGAAVTNLANGVSSVLPYDLEIREGNTDAVPRSLPTLSTSSSPMNTSIIGQASKRSPDLTIPYPSRS